MTCRRAAELISGELDADLPFHQRTGLGFHALLCIACRRYRRQQGVIETAIGEFFAADAVNSETTLTLVSKEQLKAMIQEHLESGQ